MRFLALIFTVLTACLYGIQAHAAASIPEDKSSFVVLVYHRIGEDSMPDASLRTEQFMQHLEAMVLGDYNILPLGQIIDTIKNHGELPPRTLAITFEGAYKSAYNNAMLKLAEEQIPFTVFYSSSQIDNPSQQNMDWTDLKSIASKPGVSLGVLPASYTNLSQEPEEEIRRQVNKALIRHRAEFNQEPLFFSYPFGEYSPAFKKIVADSGFHAAFGLQSGAAFDGSDMLILPRFTMTDRFGDLERFRLVVNALPLPAIEVEPQDPHLGDEVPSIGFSLPPYLAGEIKDLSCFITGQPSPDMEILGNRVEIRLSQKPGDERVRLNCTLPGPMDAQTDIEKWRWLGMLLIGESLPAPAAGDDTPSPPPDVPQ